MLIDVATALRAAKISIDDHQCDTLCLKLQQEPFNFTPADMADITVRLCKYSEKDLQVPQLTIAEQLTLMHAIDTKGEVGAVPRTFSRPWPACL